MKLARGDPSPASGHPAHRLRWALGPALVVSGLGLIAWADAPQEVAIAAMVGLAAASGFLGGLWPALFASSLGAAYLSWSMAVPSGSWRYPPPVDVELAVAVAALLVAALPSGVLKKRANDFFTERALRFKADARRRHIERIVDDLDLVVFTISEGWLVKVSKGVEWVLGYKPADLLSDPSLWVERTHPDDRVLVANLRSIETSVTWPRSAEYRMFDRDGKIVWLSETIWPSSGGVAHGRCIDITELKRSETRLTVMHAVAKAVDEAQDLHEAAPPILEAICRSLEWDLGLLWLLDKTSASMRCVESYAGTDPAHEVFIEASLQRAMARGEGLPGRVWDDGRAHWILDVVSDDNFPRASAAEKAGLHSAFAFPIFNEEETLGVIEFFTHNVEQPDDELLKLMASIGAQLGQFVKRREAERAVRESEALKSAILETALDCIISIDSEGRVIDFNPAAEEVFGYCRDQVIGRPLDKLIVPEGLRERHRTAILSFDPAAPSSLMGRRIEMPAIRSDGTPIEVELAITPVQTDGPVIFTGYIRDITLQKIQERDRAFLDEVGALASSSLDYHSSMTGVASKIVPYLADICLVDVIDEERRVTRVAEVPGGDDRPLFDFDRFLSEESDEHPIARALRTGQSELVEKVSPSIIDSIARHGSDVASLEGLDIGSFMVVPIMTGAVIHGSLTLIDLTRQRPYGPDELALAERVARRISRPLELSLLLRKKTKEARTLQMSLRPLKLPKIPGLEVGHEFRPATGGRSEMGGDFYDAFLYPNGQNRWGLVIGDVSGKGVQAAVLTALVRNTVFSEALQEREPRRILFNLNQAIIEFVSRALADQFCTVIYAKIDSLPTGARVSFVCAGHPLPLVARASGEVETIGEPGSLLGVFPEVDLRETSVDLGPGDRFVMYTDGVTDARSNGDCFGEDRLKEVVRDSAHLDAKRTASAIRAAIETYVDGEHRDDVAVLVLKVPD